MKEGLLKEWERFLARHLGAIPSSDHESHVRAAVERMREDEAEFSQLEEKPEVKRFLNDFESMRIVSYSDKEFVAAYNGIAHNWGRYVDPANKFSLLEELAKRISGVERVLDVGCGNGLYLTFLAKEGLTDACLVGVDPSEVMLDKATEIVAHEGVVMDLIEAFGQSLPFEDKSFDLVFSFDALHWSMQWLQMVREMARVVSDDGQILIGFTISKSPFRSEPEEGRIVAELVSLGFDIDQVSTINDEKGFIAKIVIGAKRQAVDNGLIVIPQSKCYVKGR